MRGYDYKTYTDRSIGVVNTAAILRYVAIGYCRPDVKEVALETFESMDLDKSGRVSFAEFKVAMEKKGGQKLSMAALKAFFDSFDKDKDGELSLEEIENLVL
ncbi:unnamed protein product [Taenia asiatica]|uniref:EF-hand domain-containing protein n=1 Tax=Taenia asiatica TaxID=60517 RepID=A0A0R3W8L9_TAEAS|nr:unnamed protein product [Taenia asiatica]